MKNNDLKDVTEALAELCDDTSVPKNVKAKFQEMMRSLADPAQVSLKIDKALQELDAIGDDSNLQPYVRTQIWNLVSLLEKVQF